VAERRRTGELAELVVVGDGPELGRLTRLARDLSVPTRFVGKTTHPEALAWIAAADALAFASEEEGLSTVLREAAALGTAIVHV
jgi:teichuronic acid biosynthesis glycosyltransferase TuaC